MTLQEIFDQLTYGELSQLSIGGGEAGAITPANYGKIVAHVNLGLTALYKRFPLKENQVTIGLSKGVLVYSLDSNGDVNFVKGGEDGEDFSDDILKIERVVTSLDADLPLNDGANPLSCFTPNATVLRVPALIVDKSPTLADEYKTDTLKIVYRANHPRIIKTTVFNPNSVVVELPPSHLEPLLLYVASRVHTPMGAGQFEGLAGNNYYTKYEASCQAIEISNLKVDQDSQSTRLRDNGWV